MKIHINTLAPYNSYGGGLYWMTSVKKMTPTKDFLDMDFKNKNCVFEPYEDCKAKRLLEGCKCVPWEMPGFEVRICKQDMIVSTSQDIKKCSARGRDCIDEKANATFDCQTPCQGIHADITHWDDWKSLETMEIVLQPIMRKYESFKQSELKHFRFNCTAASKVFGRILKKCVEDL